MLAVVEETESALGIDRVGFRSDVPDHAADLESLVRQLIALGGDVTGLWMGVARRFVPPPMRSAATDIAVIVGVTQHVPRFRETVEHRVGWPVADVALEIAGAMSSGLGQGPLGPMVDLMHRSATLAEAVARRHAWQVREPHLFARGPVVGSSSDRPVSPRPVPVPPGPVERYAERAWPLSAVAFAVALPLTRNLERATAALSAGLPKAARLGREAFAVQLGRGLADRGTVVVDARALRLLDRIDTVVIEAGLLDGHDGVAATVERAGLSLCIAGEPVGANRLGVHEVLPGGEALGEEIRLCQLRGKVVLVLGTWRSNTGLAAADCAVGIHVEGEPTPWSAHLICPADPGHASLIVEACTAAREVSSQSAAIALAGASVAGLVSFTGLIPGMGTRATTAVNLATMASIANGVRAGLGLVNRPEPPPRDPTPWHALTVEETLDRLGSSLDGLDDTAAAGSTRQATTPRPQRGGGRQGRGRGAHQPAHPDPGRRRRLVAGDGLGGRCRHGGERGRDERVGGWHPAASRQPGRGRPGGSVRPAGARQARRRRAPSRRDAAGAGRRHPSRSGRGCPRRLPDHPGHGRRDRRVEPHR